MDPEEMQDAGGAVRDPLEDMPGEGYRFRNHPQVILDNVIAMAVMFGILYLLNMGSMQEQIRLFTAAAALVIALVTGYSFFVWKRTVFTFTREEILVSRVALSKVEKRIRYDRLASVGVNRTITNRLLGTSTLTFNVNSSVNALAAEARLVLKKDMADDLRDSLNAMIFRKEFTVREETERFESMVQVSNGDIILHSILGQSTAQAIYGLVMLLYAIYSLFSENQSGFIVAAFLLIIGEVYPMVRQILKYFNYRIIRVGDTITVESGMITTRRSSFKVNKINSVRVRAPLLARLFGKAVMEAEVVGLADQDSDNVPLLCPLKGRDEVEGLMRRLVPELTFEPEPERQPRSAIVPMVLADILLAAAIIAVFAGIIIAAEKYMVVFGGFWESVARLVEVCAIVLAPVLIFGHSGLAQRHRAFAMGPESFMFVYGAYDLNTEFINYDKVQYVDVHGGPIQRRFGVSRCTVSMMSSAGFKSIESGLFDPESLERVAEEVMARIRDGRYDHRRYY